ncbi:ATP-dependent helicase HrpB [Syntrophotalea acetylenivorans]|uniref:ATP-dependent helicase HrpB n=1 Tax=Syntrophotalea acetylenivorans TaxID=1842532 RepID=UPI000AF85553
MIFDEFHERNLHSDLALALCRDVQLGLRDDLKLLVMSATLDGEPIARLLGDAPLLSSSGRSFPVAIRYLDKPPVGRPAEYAAAAVIRAWPATEGDLLVFLPGVGDIQRCRELLAGHPVMSEALLCPLYADLSFVDQERALTPAAQRKVVLATNIAETSLTIEGVRVVIDSGYMRQPRFDAGSGLQHLQTVRISAANAVQRAGRAGRLGPGECWRLWTEGEQGGLLPFAPPEIRSADLAPLALELARWGITNVEQLAWLDPPPATAMAQGQALLRLLGALDETERITPYGEGMAALPAHPRLAALLLTAKAREQLPLACDLVALLSERDPLRHPRRASHRSKCDLLERLEVVSAWRARRKVNNHFDAGACRAIDRTARYWRKHFGLTDEPTTVAPTVEELGPLVAAAYPDRIGRLRESGDSRYLLSGGQGGKLSPRCGVGEVEFLVAVNMSGGRKGDGQIHSACTIQGEVLEALFSDRLAWRRQVCWDRERQRVVAGEVRLLGALPLAERPVTVNAEEMLPALFEGLRLLGLDILGWSRASRALQQRVQCVAAVFPEQEWPDFSDQALLASLESWLAPFASGLRSRDDLSRFDPLQALNACLSWPQSRLLDEMAPTHLLVPSGRKVALEYQAEGPPVLAVKLQELFGLADTPGIAAGRIPVLIHLLSPARRPLAVTQDLASFWNSVYPDVKKEMAGRYPKHPWPDDPWQAAATRSVKGKKRGYKPEKR